LVFVILASKMTSPDHIKKSFDVQGALKKALGGGLSGAAAMVIQVCTLMPLR
jgi:predicted RNA-binding protein (virulence factor B family)